MPTEIVTSEAATGLSKLAASDNLPQFGDKRDVAAMARVSRRTVDNFLADGCPHIKLGARRVRFDLAEVRAWLKQKYGTQRRGPAKASS